MLVTLPKHRESHLVIDWIIWGSIPGRCKRLSLSKTSRPAPIQWVQLALSQGEKQLKNEADQSAPLNADVRNKQSLTSTSICLYGVHRTLLQMNILLWWTSIVVYKGHRSPGHQVTYTTQLCMLAHNICGSLVQNLHHVTFLAPLFLRWLTDFWKICEPLHYSMSIIRLSNFPYRYSFYTTKIHVMRDTYAKISCGSRIISVKWLEYRLDTLRILVYCDATCNSKQLIQQKLYERQ